MLRETPIEKCALWSGQIRLDLSGYADRSKPDSWKAFTTARAMIIYTRNVSEGGLIALRRLFILAEANSGFVGSWYDNSRKDFGDYQTSQ